MAEGKDLLGELARLILQTQMETFATCARVCRDCMKLRRRRDIGGNASLICIVSLCPCSVCDKTELRNPLFRFFLRNAQCKHLLFKEND